MIGYLYEVCQFYPTVLLSEKLDVETREILKDKNFFPKLKEIVPIYELTEKKANLITKNKQLSRLAEKLIERYEPDIVIAPGSYFFELYLRRFAIKKGAISISGKGPFFLKDLKERDIYRLLMTADKTIPNLPFYLKIFFARLKKHFGQILYFWIYPVLAGQAPFIGYESNILWDLSRSKGADYYFVFSQRNYEMFRQAGASEKKHFVLAHPLAGKSRDFFEKAFFSKAEKPNRKTITIMEHGTLTGIRRKDFSLITKEQREKNRVKAVRLISRVLNDWNIYIKPHPLDEGTSRISEMTELFNPISDSVKIVNPMEPADKYIEISDAIAAYLPDTTIFTGLLQCSEKPFLIIDLDKELLGSSYENPEAVEYVDNEEKLIDVLERIRDNKIVKSKKELKKEGFSGMVELLEFLIKKKDYGK